MTLKLLIPRDVFVPSRPEMLCEETTTRLSFYVHRDPIPMSVKHSPHWSCDESKKDLFSGDLVSFLVCTRNLDNDRVTVDVQRVDVTYVNIRQYL